LTTITTP